MRKFGVIEGGMSEDMVEPVRKKIIEYSVKEGQVFSREEIISIINEVAQSEGFQISDLEVLEENYNADGDLVQLDVSVRKGRTLGEGWGKILYAYMIKGGGKMGGTATTGIMRAYSTISEPDKYQVGGTVAEYENGGWTLTPGTIHQSVSDIENN